MTGSHEELGETTVIDLAPYEDEREERCFIRVDTRAERMPQVVAAEQISSDRLADRIDLLEGISPRCEHATSF